MSRRPAHHAPISASAPLGLRLIYRLHERVGPDLPALACAVRQAYFDSSAKSVFDQFDGRRTSQAVVFRQGEPKLSDASGVALLLRVKALLQTVNRVQPVAGLAGWIRPKLRRP